MMVGALGKTGHSHHSHTHIDYNIQWNLGITDTLGPAIFPIIHSSEVKMH